MDGRGKHAEQDEAEKLLIDCRKCYHAASTIIFAWANERAYGYLTSSAQATALRTNGSLISKPEVCYG